jgi:uncharacterized 2Fe-2S/4Fe-4S cluster protein (DUF4445 family)
VTGVPKQHIRVVFQPEGRSVYVLQGSLLIEAAAQAGIVLDTPCGGQATCGKCRVDISKGAPEPSEVDRKFFTDEQLASGSRLACRTRVDQEMIVEIPVAARFFDQKILTDGEGREVTLAPTVSKIHVQLPEPSLEDQRSDVDRLLEALPEALDPTHHFLSELPTILRQNKFDVTVAAGEGRIIAVEPGDTTARNFGMAFDIGTTTVVGFLMDLHTGRELAVAARGNPQTAFGADVVTRIQHAEKGPEQLKELQGKIVQCLNDIIQECCEKSGHVCEHLYEATVAGNTTMNHILLGVNPQYIAQAPYVAALRESVNVRARDIGLTLHPRGIVHTLPNIAGFVGGDTVGVILSSGMHKSDKPIVAIDIGTNGELVVGNKGRLIACSTAAGPAFEGARIKFGMRAADGAIDKCIINDDLEYNVIGNVLPRGICGTALIDLVAELLRVGIIEATGRVREPGELPADLPETLAKRVVEGENGFSILIVAEDETQIDGSIFLTQRDIREMQLAKGAISAGVNIMLGEMGLQASDLDQVLLAGAFGNFIRRNMAKGIGLLPDVPNDRIRYIGNAAGAGARMALQSRACKDEANRISDHVEYLELAGRTDFQMEFASAMMFPMG